MTTPPTILFVSLAMNQAVFFEAIGQKLSNKNIPIAHVCFHDGSVKALRERGCEVFNPFDFHNDAADKINFSDYAIDQPSLLIGHEKAAYQIRDTATISRKFKRHIHAMEQILDTLNTRAGGVIVVQELGGFTSVLAAYYAAHARGIDNWFIEPSFFRGRLFFTPNSLSAPKISQDSHTPENPQVINYLQSTLESRSVVIPDKDRKHYRGAIHKLTDRQNIRRLFEKIAAKHLHGEREEFNHIGGHVMRHLRMQTNYLRLKKHYQVLPKGRPFIYYPLHVPADFALTIRSPEYFDQYTLIDYICRIAPLGYQVAIKEHPALVGAIDPTRINSLIKQHDNFVLLKPGINNHEVLANCEMVITVNSKSGAEAILHQRPVFALGDSFYRDSPLITAVERLKDLPRLIASPPSLDNTLTHAWFQAVWEASVPGELYSLDKNNLHEFSESLYQKIFEQPPLKTNT